MNKVKSELERYNLFKRSHERYEKEPIDLKDLYVFIDLVHRDRSLIDMMSFYHKSGIVKLIDDPDITKDYITKIVAVHKYYETSAEIMRREITNDNIFFDYDRYVNDMTVNGLFQSVIPINSVIPYLSMGDIINLGKTSKSNRIMFDSDDVWNHLLNKEYRYGSTVSSAKTLFQKIATSRYRKIIKYMDKNFVYSRIQIPSENTIIFTKCINLIWIDIAIPKFRYIGDVTILLDEFFTMNFTFSSHNYSVNMNTVKVLLGN